MKKIKIILLILITINLSGCMKKETILDGNNIFHKQNDFDLFPEIDFSKTEVDNKNNYVDIKDFDPYLLFLESPKKLQEFAKNNWDVIKKTVNDFTKERYNFASEPTLIAKTGQIQSPTIVYIKSLEHDNLVLMVPISCSSEYNTCDITSNENELATLDDFILGYLSNYAFYEDLKPLNDATREFMEINNIEGYNEKTQEILGKNNLFEIKGSLYNYETYEEMKNELLNYFKTVKYEDYSAEEIKKLVKNKYNPYKDENSRGYGDCSAIMFNNVEQIDKKILEKYILYLKEKKLKLPPFKFYLDNAINKIMFTTGMTKTVTSFIEFNNDYEIIRLFNNEDIIDDETKLWKKEEE